MPLNRYRENGGAEAKARARGWQDPERTDSSRPGCQRPGLEKCPRCLPPPPCPPFQWRDVRFCQVAHTCQALGLVTAYCLRVIATQAHPVTSQAGREQPALTRSPRLPRGSCVSQPLTAQGTWGLTARTQTLAHAVPRERVAGPLGALPRLGTGELELAGEAAGTRDRPGGRAHGRRSGARTAARPVRRGGAPSVFPREPEGRTGFPGQRRVSAGRVGGRRGPCARLGCQRHTPLTGHRTPGIVRGLGHPGRRTHTPDGRRERPSCRTLPVPHSS